MVRSRQDLGLFRTGVCYVRWAARWVQSVTFKYA